MLNATKDHFGRFRQNYKLRMRMRHSTHQRCKHGSKAVPEGRKPVAARPEIHFQVVTGSSRSVLTRFAHRSISACQTVPEHIMERVSLLAVAVNLLLALMLNRVDGSVEGLRTVTRVQVGLSAARGRFCHHFRFCCNTAEF